MTTLSLSADKTIVKGNETVKFTANYPGEVGKNIILMQRGWTVFNDVPVGNAMTNSSGVAVISWRSATQGKFDFYAIHSIIPGISDCGFWCEKSGQVSVSVTDAPCDPSDPLCVIGGGIERALTRQQIIMAVVAVIIILVLIYMYFPKKRS